MEMTPSIVYGDVPKSPALEELLYKKIAHLEKICPGIISCHVALQKSHGHPNSGHFYRVRINLRLPPEHELVVSKKSDEGKDRDNGPLWLVVRESFDAMEKQVKKIVARRRGDKKFHPQQTVGAFVNKIFREDGYGFIITPEGREIYFHRNSVLHNNFDRLEIGTGVRFAEEMGDEGPQASTVDIVDKPGHRIGLEFLDQQRSDQSTWTGP